MTIKEFLGEIDTIGEKALWQSVIMQAAIDVTNDPRELKDRIERAKTIAWFSLHNEDFILVCSLAEMNPEDIIQKIKPAIQSSKKHHKKRKAKQRRNRRITQENNNEPISKLNINA